MAEELKRLEEERKAKEEAERLAKEEEERKQAEILETYGGSAPTEALYSLNEFLFTGKIYWDNLEFTYYSQSVLPGGGLTIPGRHINEGGYVADENGYIVLAGSAEKGTIYNTPFGYQGKIYDMGTFGNHLDVYIR